jgi:FkbM family methyltransferase
MSAAGLFLTRVKRYAGLVRHMAGNVEAMNAFNAHIADRLANLTERQASVEGALAKVSGGAFAPSPAALPVIAPVAVAAAPAGPAYAWGAPDSFRIPKFWETSYWEHSVQHPLRDYCRPGDVVFDVGANAGALSMLMSRLVGPRGTVCAFEASPRIIDKTHFNLVDGGYTNVQLYYRAVYHTTGEYVTMYPGTHLNDSIYNDYGTEGGVSFKVETIALDDYCDATGLDPKVIKMDIEGAELDALKGMQRMLARAKPVLILEQSPTDMACHEFLVARGYQAIDLGTYKRIKTAADFAAGVNICNVLFVHPDEHPNDPYLAAKEPVKVTSLPASAFTIAENGSISLAEGIKLPAGRYVCVANFTAAGDDNEIFCGIDDEHARIFRYHTYTKMMAENYREWVFTLRAPATVRPYLQYIRGRDATLDWQGVDVFRYPAFDKVKAPVVY